METVEYKFPPKTKVFYLERETKPTFCKCPTCNGEGKIAQLTGAILICPTCNSEGEIRNGSSIQEIVKSSKVEEIIMSIDESGIYLAYNLEYTDSSFHESKLFSTEEEAENHKSKGAMGSCGTTGTVGKI